MNTLRIVTLVILFLMAFVTGVSAQEKSDPPSTCKVKVVVAAVNWDNGGDPQFGRMTPDQIAWWRKDGQKKFPKICLVSTRDEADYAVAWKYLQTTDKYIYTIPHQETTYHSGTVNGTSTRIGSNPTYTNGTYSGTSTTTRYETRQGEWPVVYVHGAVFKNGGSDIPIFVSKHKGQWRWSKPDKDALVESLKFIRKMVEEEPKP